MATWELRDYDAEFFENELDDFVPEQVFDAHAHLYHLDHSSLAGVSPVAQGPRVLTLREYRRQMEWITPRRATTGLFFSDAMEESHREVSNRFVAAQLAADGGCRGHLVVSPSLDPEFVRQEVKRHGFAGLKVYHTFCSRKPSWDADLNEYLPEEYVRVADQEGWSITVHLVKARALADSSNQEWILHYCRTYPNIRLILAHAGRGFNPFHTIAGIRALAGLRNVWLDTSAVTEAGGFEAIVQVLGHDRLLWGSDFPVSHFRGRCVAIGDEFVWLYEDTLDWNAAAHAPIRPLFIGHESLRALKLAASRLHLTDSQVEDIFRHNARRMFAL